MSTGKTLFILALIFRHRLRYAVERFIYTGKIDEGVSKTLQSNIQSLTQPDKVMALPRVSSEAAMVHLIRQQQVQQQQPKQLIDASNVMFQPPSPSLSTMGAYSEVQPLHLDADAAAQEASGSVTSGDKTTDTTLGQTRIPRRDWPFSLPTNKLGFRMCGCAEIDPCSHKDSQGKPLPSYETAYAAWRSRLDRRCLFAVIVWLSARRFLRKDQTLFRRAAAVAVELSSSLMPQLVVLYKLTSQLDSTSNLPLKLLLRVLACYSITYFASHQTISLPHAMVQASRQFKFPAIPPLIESPDVTDETVPATPAAVQSSSADASGPHFTELSLSVAQPTRVPTVRDIVMSVLKDTPRVTLRVLRFYSLLFLVIRPLARMKNPFRKSAQVVRDIAGAVVTLTIARFGFAAASLWRTTDKDKVWLIQLARFATVTAAVLTEYGLLAVTLPQNSGTALLHAFVAASGLTSVGAFLIGYDRFRRLCCALDACAGELGVSGSLLGLT